jgi:hypothetical protein
MKTQLVHRLGKSLLSTHTGQRAYYALTRAACRLVPDRPWLAAMYLMRVGRPLHLDPPRTFTEKIQWLKLYRRNPRLTTLADKYAVRQYVAEHVGTELLIPLVGVYDSFEQVPFSELPDRFILKATHGSGWNVLCRDRGAFDTGEARRQFALWMRTNYYWPGRSWPYKNIQPRVLCEHLLSTGDTPGLDDYKIHCFGGRPAYIQYITGRFVGQTRESFYDTDWTLQEFTLTFPPHDRPQPAPQRLRDMVHIASKLSQGLAYARIDLYEVGGRVYFGEVTLHPANGMDNFTPRRYDDILGEMVDLGDGA